MAEVVHRNLEAMLPQLEELEASGLFTHDEIRTIIKFRRGHEYRMMRRPARKEDFLAAIRYELHLDLLRKRRKKRFGVMGTKQDADYGIQNRIHGLHRRILKKFKGDLKLWLQYIEFAKASNHKLSLSKIFGKALAIHPNSTSLWVMAAKFQFEEMKDVASSRSLLQQSLRANSTSKHLWMEYFRMELMHTDKVRKRREVLGLEEEEEESKLSDDFLSYKVPLIVFNQAIKAIPQDVEFRLSLLPVCSLFPDTQSLQDEIYESVRRDFPSHSLTWNALARRHWQALDTHSLEDHQIIELEAKSEEIFTEGISSVEFFSDITGEIRTKSRGIWDSYFKWSIERLEESNSPLLKKKAKQRLENKFRQASKDGQLSEQTYEEYVKVLNSFNLLEEASLIMSEALTAHPTSVRLWLMKIQGVETSLPSIEGTGTKEHVKELGGMCRKALEQILPKDSLPIWQLWVKKLIDTATHQDIETVFEDGMSCNCKEVSEPLSELFLDWAFKVGGISKARKIYSKLLKFVPVPFSLYKKCFEVEQQVTTTSSGRGMKKLRELFEKAVRDYGSTHTELWLMYLSAELHLDGGNLEEVGRLYWRAMKMLQPSLTADFIQQYSLLHADTDYETIS